MSQRIMAELTNDFIRRLRNWASLNGREGKAEISPSSMFSAAGGGNRREATMPRLEGEAQDTDRALSVLPIRYRQAVMLFWQYENQPLSVLARRCGQGVDYRTYRDRVMQGHILLRSEIFRNNQIMSDRREQFERRSICSKMRNTEESDDIPQKCGYS